MIDWPDVVDRLWAFHGHDVHKMFGLAITAHPDALKPLNRYSVRSVPLFECPFLPQDTAIITRDNRVVGMVEFAVHPERGVLAQIAVKLPE